MMYDPRLAEDLWRFAEKMRYPNPAEIDYSELEYTLRRAADIVDGKEEREYQRTWKYLFKGLFKAAFSLFLYFCAFLEIYRFLDSHGLAGGDSPSGLMMFAALALFGGIIVLLSHDDGRGWLI